jgi:hypothetical protein
MAIFAVKLLFSIFTMTVFKHVFRITIRTYFGITNFETRGVVFGHFNSFIASKNKKEEQYCSSFYVLKLFFLLIYS